MPHFMIMSIDYSTHGNCVTVTVTTNNPVNLWIYVTDVIPDRHVVSRRVRGIDLPWGGYWCYVAATKSQQQETGDTTSHTFEICGLTPCETYYFVFYGTYLGYPVDSVSAIFPYTFQPTVTLVLNPIKDTWLNKTTPNSNFGSSVEMRRTRYYHWYFAYSACIFSFDSSSVPAGAVLTSASLKLYYFAYSQSGIPVWIYKLKYGTWIESQATYNQMKTGVSWSSGHFSPSDWYSSNPSGSVSYITPGSPPWSVTFDILDIAQNCLAGGGNFDLVLTGQDGITGSERYRTREQGWEMPTLTLEYTQPC